MPNDSRMHGMPLPPSEQLGETLQRQGRVSTREILDRSSGRSKAVLLEALLGKDGVFRLLRIEQPKAQLADFAESVTELKKGISELLVVMPAPPANPFPQSWPDFGLDDDRIAYERGITACEIYYTDVVKSGAV